MDVLQQFKEMEKMKLELTSNIIWSNDTFINYKKLDKHEDKFLVWGDSVGVKFQGQTGKPICVEFRAFSPRQMDCINTTWHRFPSIYFSVVSMKYKLTPSSIIERTTLVDAIFNNIPMTYGNARI